VPAPEDELLLEEELLLLLEEDELLELEDDALLEAELDELDTPGSPPHADNKNAKKPHKIKYNARISKLSI